MGGIDRTTGRPLGGWLHVVQSVGVILSTPIGSRVMRRTFGSVVPGLLGQNITSRTALRFVTAIMIALELWEPRFRLKQAVFDGNTPEAARAGGLRIRLLGEYRPRGHLGDPTPEGTGEMLVSAGGASNLVVT